MNRESKRKIILSFIGILFIGISAFVAKKIVDSNTKKQPKPKKVVKTVFVETVENKTVPIIISANGNLRAQRRLELFSEVQGVFRMGKKLFKPGQKYRRGERLIRIDASEYMASVTSQKSNLYNQIAAIMPDLRLDYPDAFEKWQQYLDNFNINKSVPPLPEIDSDKEKFFITGRNIVTSYYNLKNQEQRLGKYSIYAPFTGILTEALVTEGTLIRPGQKLGEFIDTSAYELEAAIPKTYADLLKIGKEVNLKTIDGKQNYKGKVTRINGNINRDSQTINAYIQVKDESLREGIYLEAKLKAKEETDAIVIHRSLLQPNDQLFVVKDSVLDLVTAKPVYFSEKTVVVKGLEDGIKLVNKPVPGAYAGMLVKIHKEKEENSQAISEAN